MIEQGNKIFAICLLGVSAMILNCSPVYLSRKPPEGEILIRIALQRRQPRAVVYGSYNITVWDQNHKSAILPGESWSILPAGLGLTAETNRGTAIENIEGRIRLWSTDEYFINQKRVKGAIEIRRDNDQGLLVIAEMPLEDYLPGVLASEIGGLADKAPQAAMAQAIISRSYAFARIGAKPESYYDIEAGTSHQCFDLDNVASSTIKRAVNDTKGKVLTFRGKMISPNFHSTCGGRTARPSEIWNARDEEFPYLESVEDKWCGISPKYSWSDTIMAEELAVTVFPGKQEIIKDVKVLKVGKSGRVISLLVSTSAGDSVLTKAAVRNGLKDKPLLSTWFGLENIRNAQGDIEKVILTGRGFGHGVGLCQWGAIGMARAGKNYKSILKHFYKGVEIDRIY
jgi:stage II sporulation protein D